jgi:polysaccharide chain length determinant protein (PEP-CTERM system associated)
MISFKANDPRLAQEVTSRLTSLFIEENIKSQGSQASTTSKFLQQQLDSAKQRLDQQEWRLRDFKMKNLGELPEQEQANLGTITDLRIQLQNNMANASRAQQQRISLESTLSGNLARLTSERTALLTRLTPKHPDVLKKDTEIERSQALLSRLKSGAPGAPKPLDSFAAEDPVIAQLKGQVETNAVETENLAREEQRLRVEIAQYQSRLKLTPMREQQLAAILRDYELFKQDYTDLLNRQLKSQLTTNMEEQQAGQHFRLVDPPTLPARPSSPKRLKMSLIAIAAGIVLGVAIALLVDFGNRSFYTEKEVARRFSPPLLVGVPYLRTPAEERWRGLRIAFEWVLACLVAVITLAAEFYVYRHR